MSLVSFVSGVEVLFKLCHVLGLRFLPQVGVFSYKILSLFLSWAQEGIMRCGNGVQPL
jgi:hypothetical protein